MRSGFGMLLVVGLAACTEYHPVAFDGRGSWAEARAAAARTGAAKAVAPSPSPAAPRPAERYLVLPGESLPQLASQYGVASGAATEASARPPAYAARSNQILALPTASSAAAAPPVVPLPAATLPAPAAGAGRAAATITVAELPGEAAPLVTPAVAPAALEASRHAALKTPPALSGEGFLWPVKGDVVSKFGEKPNGGRNNGIDILATAGTPVRAAENGIVVYAGDGIPGYGNMLLITHANGMVTAYAHNRELLVAVGTVVSRGQTVARVGNSGGVGLPQLHFELRDGRRAVDPIAYLDTGGAHLASTR
ncbi:MAG: M23 family metallopeptidase [Geminicoccaceae bacterium]